ncbi:hypothetical protein GQ473_07435 [archaeon]|nr:hypothetical protein [archaeon]
MSIELLRKGKKKQLAYKKEITLKELLNTQKINTETVLVKLNGTIATLDEKIKDQDKLEILDIISGG